MRGRNTFSTNNVGFRGPDLVMPKPRDEFRVVLVGGSTAECFYLDDADALHSAVQAELARLAPPGRQVRVYNAGKSGDTTFDHVSVTAHKIMHFAPDVVVTFAGFNDLTAALIGARYLEFVLTPWEQTLTFPRLARMTATESQIGRRLFYAVISATAPAEARLDADAVRVTQRSGYQSMVARAAKVPESSARPRLDFSAYRTNLRTLAGIAAGHGIPMVFMTQQTTWNGPDENRKRWQWMTLRGTVRYGEAYLADAMEAANDVMRAVARERGTPVYDLPREVPKTLDYFYDDVHFNVNGARTAGTGLARVIRAAAGSAL